MRPGRGCRACNHHCMQEAGAPGEQVALAPQLKVWPQLPACASTAQTGKPQPLGVAMHTSPATQSAVVVQPYCGSGEEPKFTRRQSWL